MPVFLLTYWRQIGLALLLCAAFLSTALYRGLYQHEKHAYEAYKADIEAQAEIAKAKARKEEQQRKEISESQLGAYQNAVKSLTDYYKSHPSIVRLHDTSPCGVSETRASPQGTDATTAGTVETTPAGTSAEIQIDLKKAGEELLRLIQLQQWEKQQEVIK